MIRLTLDYYLLWIYIMITLFMGSQNITKESMIFMYSKYLPSLWLVDHTLIHILHKTLIYFPYRYIDLPELFNMNVPESSNIDPPLSNNTNVD